MAEIERAEVIRIINSESRNLAGVDLSGLDLRGLDLSGVRLTGANLAGADLRDCRISEATDFTNADLTGANAIGMQRVTVKTINGVRRESASPAKSLREYFGSRKVKVDDKTYFAADETPEGKAEKEKRLTDFRQRTVAANSTAKDRATKRPVDGEERKPLQGPEAVAMHARQTMASRF